MVWKHVCGITRLPKLNTNLRVVARILLLLWLTGTPVGPSMGSERMTHVALGYRVPAARIKCCLVYRSGIDRFWTK